MADAAPNYYPFTFDADTGALALIDDVEIDVPVAVETLTGLRERVRMATLSADLGDDVLWTLLGALAGFPHLESLRLEGAWTGNAARWLARVLPSWPRLVTLDLSMDDAPPNKAETGIGLNGAKALADAIVLCEITHLELRNNRIGPDGVAALAMATPRCHGLVRLGLAGTRPGTEGALALADAVDGHATLKVLDLQNNDIHDADGAGLGRLGDRVLL